MRWLRHNWVLLVFLLAIGGTFYLGDQESTKRDRAQHVQLVAGCLRNSQRAALVSAYQHRTAEARRSSGLKSDAKIADDYDAFANSAAALIPAPAGLSATDTTLREVRKVKVASEPGYKFVLTDRALALQRAGCQRAYP